MVNLTLSDHFNEYEVVRAGAKLQSSCGEPYEARDYYITRQFVSRLNASIETWRSLFRRLGIRIPPNFRHSDEIVDAVVQSCLRGELRFYKLPKIEKLKAIPCGKGMGICFVKGPKPHSRVNLNPLDISSAQEASDLVATIIASEDDLVRYLSSTDLVPNLSSVRDVKKIITDKLAAKEILAYKIPVYTNAPPKKQGELVPAIGPGYDKVPLAPESKPVFTTVNPSEKSKDGLSQQEIDLAKSEGAAPEQIAARKSIASAFYELEGMPKSKIAGHTAGIDFSKPVEVVGFPEEKLVHQYQIPDGPQGSYYAEPGVTPSKLGISDKAKNWDTGELVDKHANPYITKVPVKALKSTAAEIVDTWSVPGTAVHTSGGEIQYFTMKQNSFVKT